MGRLSKEPVLSIALIALLLATSGCGAWRQFKKPFGTTPVQAKQMDWSENIRKSALIVEGLSFALRSALNSKTVTSAQAEPLMNSIEAARQAINKADLYHDDWAAGRIEERAFVTHMAVAVRELVAVRESSKPLTIILDALLLIGISELERDICNESRQDC